MDTMRLLKKGPGVKFNFISSEDRSSFKMDSDAKAT